MAGNTQIATILVPCLVLKRNNTVFKTDDNVVGQIEEVPCRNVDIKEIPFWMEPVKDDGIFSTLEPILATGGDSSQPTVDSLLATRVIDKLSETTWHIYTPGGYTDFVNSCNTCCQSPWVPMPGTDGTFLQRIAPCQILCEITNDSGQYVMYFGIPSLAAGQAYFPYGTYNNTYLAAASPTGYTTIAALLAFLNGSWNVGSPPITWTASTDGLTLISTGGSLYDQLCVVVTAVTA